MIFPYWEAHHNGERRLAPLVEVQLHGTETAVRLFALIDSGAEHNVFDEDLARRARLSLENGRPVTVLGVGEGTLSGRMIMVDLQLGKHRWTAPTIFARGLARRALLGQAGFFAFFTVTFRHHWREIEVRRARQ